MLSLARTHLLTKYHKSVGLRCFADKKNFEEQLGRYRENPFKRAMRILGNDMRTLKNRFVPGTKLVEREENYIERLANENFQSYCDVLVIGGGGVGSSIAYWLKKRARDGLNVVVVEKDSMYSKCSTSLSVGGLRQQFSVVENIQMSLYGADFLRNIKEHLGDDIDVNFVPHGYLMLASEEGAQTLIENSKLQNVLGAKNEVLTADKLKQKFPWLNTDGIAVGCHGLEKEGWFDPWSLLHGYKKRALEYGAHYVEGEVVGFELLKKPETMMENVPQGDYEALDRAYVRMKSGEMRDIKFSMCIIAAGASSGEIGKMAKLGTGPGMLSYALPVEPRKRYVYVFECENNQGPGLNAPLTIDPTNTYFRRDGLGGNYIAGRSPSFEDEPAVDNMDVDYSYFETDVWPRLAQRIPSFEAIKLKSAWAGFYEFNTFDENGIIGRHPYHTNLFIATGFSGHGIQQTPAIGRAISEMIIEGKSFSIDLDRLGFDRIIVEKPMYETNIV